MGFAFVLATYASAVKTLKWLEEAHDEIQRDKRDYEYSIQKMGCYFNVRYGLLFAS